MRRLILLSCLISTASLAGGAYVRVPAGEFQSVLKYEDNKGKQKVVTFDMMKQPVTNAQFLEFVRTHPQWQRGKTPVVFAEQKHYLSHWQAPLVSGRECKTATTGDAGQLVRGIGLLRSARRTVADLE